MEAPGSEIRKMDDSMNRVWEKGVVMMKNKARHFRVCSDNRRKNISSCSEGTHRNTAGNVQNETTWHSFKRNSGESLESSSLPW